MKTILTLSAIILGALALPSPAVPDNPKPPKRVLILTGLEYPGHKWQQTAPILKDILSKDGSMQVTIQEDPNFLADPKLQEYDAIVLNYMNWQKPDPGQPARDNLRKFVDSGKGLVLVHFACGAFQGWDEFVKIAGRVWNPKLRGHDPYGKFQVRFTNPDHPITKGLETFETQDELYTCLDGVTPIEVLAVATSKVDKKDYPMAFILNYGKGRTFHCVLGHDPKAFEAQSVKDLYLRGTSWAAGN